MPVYAHYVPRTPSTHPSPLNTLHAPVAMEHHLSAFHSPQDWGSLPTHLYSPAQTLAYPLLSNVIQCTFSTPKPPRYATNKAPSPLTHTPVLQHLTYVHLLFSPFQFSLFASASFPFPIVGPIRWSIQHQRDPSWDYSALHNQR